MGCEPASSSGISSPAAISEVICAARSGLATLAGLQREGLQEGGGGDGARGQEGGPRAAQ